MERGDKDAKMNIKEKEAALIQQLVMANTGSPEALQKTSVIIAGNEESPWMKEIDADLRNSRPSRISRASRASSRFPRSSFASDVRASDAASVTSFDSDGSDGTRSPREDESEGSVEKNSSRRKRSRLTNSRAGKNVRGDGTQRRAGVRTGLDGLHQDLNTFQRIMAMADEDDTPFINSTRANAYIGIIIFANCLSIGAETDLSPKDGDGTAAQQWSWYIVECVFTLIFTVEALWRWQVMGCQYWKSGWNVFDFVVVVFSILDAGVLTWVTSKGDGGGSQLRIMSVLRILRLLRLVRVLRLFRLFKELWLLLLALWKALKGLTWVMMLLFITDYTCAILLTIMIGHRVDEDDPLSDQWGTVARSMLTLFIVTTGEGWNDIALDAMEVDNLLVLFFVPFVIFTNIMVLNLVVGITVQELLESKRLHEMELQRQFDEEAVKKLASIFATLDEDGNGSIETGELREALQNASFQAELKSLNIFVGEDAEMMMNIWDSDHSGQLDFNEFVQGAMAIMHCEPSQQILFLKYDVHSFSSRTLKKLDKIIEWQDERSQSALSTANPSKPKYYQKQRSTGTIATGRSETPSSSRAADLESKPARARDSAPASLAVPGVAEEERVARRRAMMHSRKADGTSSMPILPSVVDSEVESSSSPVPAPRTVTEVISTGNTWEALPANTSGTATVLIEDLQRVVTEQHNKLVVSIENIVLKAIKEEYVEIQKEMVAQRQKLTEDLSLCIEAALRQQSETCEDFGKERIDHRPFRRGTSSSPRSSSALRAAASAVPKPPEEPRIRISQSGDTVFGEGSRSALSSREHHRELVGSKTHTGFRPGFGQFPAAPDDTPPTMNFYKCPIED